MIAPLDPVERNFTLALLEYFCNASQSRCEKPPRNVADLCQLEHVRHPQAIRASDDFHHFRSHHSVALQVVLTTGSCTAGLATSPTQRQPSQGRRPVCCAAAALLSRGSNPMRPKDRRRWGKWLDDRHSQQQPLSRGNGHLGYYFCCCCCRWLRHTASPRL